MIYLGKCHGLNWQVLVCLVKYLFWNKIPCGPNAQRIAVCLSGSSYGWLRGIPGESAGGKPQRCPLMVSLTFSTRQRLRGTGNRKKTIAWENCLKQVPCSPCRVKALFVVWRAQWQFEAVVTIQSIYISVTRYAFLSWGACVKTVEICWPNGVCKERASLDISSFHSLCSVGSVSVVKRRC